MEKETQIQDDNPNLIQQADTAAARLEAANKVTAELLDRMERNRSIDLISGKSEAGEVKKELSPADKKKMEAMDFFKGSEIEKAMRKYG